jgi:hypothetical protein
LKSFSNATHRREILERLRRLEPDAEARWGRMTAPRMVAHLNDQMSHCLGDTPCPPVPGILRWPGIRYLSIYWLPWPRGRLKGPPEAFVTQPDDWSADLGSLIEKVERFGEVDQQGPWPDHAFFGRMSGADWGFFCFKHFHHHLRQFGR